MLRWTVTLSAYNYDLVYLPGNKISNADALSRLPQKVQTAEAPTSADVLMLENVPERCVDAKEIGKETIKDPVLAQVLQWVWKGWPVDSREFADEFQPFLSKKTEITCYQDCLLWGTRVIIPPGGRKRILEILHSGHPGIVKMKALARSHVWWPNIDRQIEQTVKTCSQCQENQHMPRKSPIHPWEWARAPWTRIHVDFAGPLNGKIFLIVIDAYSKWLEVRIVPSTSATATITVLRELFAIHGLPDVIVSDNGTAFTSQEFKDFLKRNQIRQALVAPYHPSSNGQAERMVQSVKAVLKKMSGDNIATSLSRYLFTQHITPHSVTGRSPAELLMGRKLSSLLDRLQPDFRKEMLTKQEQMYPLNSKPRTFNEADLVYARAFTSGQKWIPSTVVETTGPVSYKVATPDGKLVHRHADQLRARTPVSDSSGLETPVDEEPQLIAIENGTPSSPHMDQARIDSPLPDISSSPPSRRPVRQRRMPRYLEDYTGIEQRGN